MRKLTRVIFIVALLAAVVLPLSAKKAMNVSWEWLLSDPEVTAYRYQLNGEAEDGWTVVDGNTSVYTATGLDPYSDYTLYLQCSYDGINWSASASSTAYALLKEEAPVEEVVEVVEEPAEEDTVEDTVFYVYGIGIDNEWTKSSFKSTTLESGILTPDDILGFIQYEAEKYPSLASSLYYSVVDDGFVLTYEEGALDVPASLPLYRADITEYIDSLVVSAAEAAEAAVEAVIEEVTEAPVFEETFSYRGITSDITVYGTHAVVTLPEGTDASVIENAAALLVMKYPEAKYVTYDLDGDTVLLFYPEITGEYASSLYPVVKDEAEWYIDQLLGEVEETVEEAVAAETEAEEGPVYEATLSYKGVTSTIIVDNTWATLTIPEGMSGDDITAVAAVFSSYHPAEASIITYSVSGDTVTLTYPEQTDEYLLSALEVLRAEAVELIDMIEASQVAPAAEEPVAPAAEAAVETAVEEKKEEPAQAEVPAPVAVEAVPVEEEKKDSPKAKAVKASFNMSLNGGLEWGFGKVVSQGASKTPTIYPFVSFTLEGQNLIHFGAFGLGLRSDVSAVFIPASRNLSSNPSNIWGFDATVDLKLMTYINANICSFYVGAGLGYSAASHTFTDVHSDYAPILKSLGGDGFDTAFALTGVAGVRFNLGSVVTLSAEGYARLFFDEPGKLDTLNVAATLGFGVKF